VKKEVMKWGLSAVWKFGSGGRVVSGGPNPLKGGGKSKNKKKDEPHIIKVSRKCNRKEENLSPVSSANDGGAQLKKKFIGDYCARLKLNRRTGEET